MTEKTNRETGRLYGLIGFPLTHSFSKKYFDKKFEKEGLDTCRFENFPLAGIMEFPKLILLYKNSLKGLAVTIPYKKQVIPFLNNTGNIPAGLNACNCIKIDNEKLIGYNTDWMGFDKSFTTLLQPHHSKVLVLGSGGAAAAVCYALQKNKMVYKLVSRQKTNVDFLAYEELTPAIMQEYSVIVNTTPLGSHAFINESPLIPYELITPQHYCFDLNYNPAETVFLQKAKQAGATIKNGMEMLALQAEINWQIWNS